MPETETEMDVWLLEVNNCFEKTVQAAEMDKDGKVTRPAKKEYWRVVRFDKPETIVRNSAGTEGGLPYRVVQGEIVPIRATRVIMEPSGNVIVERWHKDPARRKQVSMKAEALWDWAAKNGLSLVLDGDDEPYRYDYNNYHETVEGKQERAKRIKPVWET